MKDIRIIRVPAFGGSLYLGFQTHRSWGHITALGAILLPSTLIWKVPINTPLVWVGSDV